ncbi:MAG: hypothetical protein ACI7YS_11055 [Flavobacterium sp.]
MPKTTLELKNIANAGGGLSIDGSSKTSLELKNIASALSSGATLIVRNAQSLTSLEMKNIASAAPGKVIFEI